MNPLTLLLLPVALFSTVITGGQDRVSVTGGTISVSSGGVTQTVNSGEITFFGENQPASKPRKLQKNDLNQIMNDLKASDPKKLISILFPAMEHKYVQRIKRYLKDKGINRQNLIVTNKSGLSELKIKHVELNKIKSIYPAYHKVGLKLSEEFAKKNKVPLLKMSMQHVRIYHKRLFR